MKNAARLLVAGSLVLLAAPATAQVFVTGPRLDAPAPRHTGHFGRAVALSGDTLAVSELHGYAGGYCPSFWLQPSRVFVRERDAGGEGAWGVVAQLDNPPLPCANGPQAFGQSLDLDGDTLVVGAPGDAFNQQGAAFVYERDLGGSGAWGLAATLTGDQLDFAQFGHSVAISAETVAVGTLYGATVHVYERDVGGPGAWGESKRLQVLDPLYGSALDLDGDTLVVGSPLHYVTVCSGRAYLYERDLGGPDNWGEVTFLEASEEIDKCRFGYATAIDGDTLLVGGAEFASNAAGAAYFFERNLGGADEWGESARVVSPLATSEWFGFGIDLDGSRAIVRSQVDGAYGAAFWFERNLGGTDNWGLAQWYSPPQPEVAVRFAESLDLDGETAVMGAHYAHYGEWNDVDALAFDPVGGVLYGRHGFGYPPQDDAFRYDPSTATGVNLGPIGQEGVGGMAYDTATNTLFAATYAPSQLLAIDTASGAGTAVGPVGFDVGSLAFDSTSGVLYGVGQDRLIAIDPATGAGSVAAALAQPFSVRALAFDPTTATLFASGSGGLAAIDPGTGALTILTPSLTLDSLAFDAASGTLYGVDVLLDQLFAVDPGTGATTSIDWLFVQNAGAALVFEREDPVSYCTAGTSAAGCSAALGVAGVPTLLQPAGFELSAAGVEGQRSGLFFLGASGRQAKPWGNGTSVRCVAPPLTRGPLMAGSGSAGQCDGAFTLDLNAHWAAKPQQHPGAGAAVQAQLWYRDPLNSSNRTSSLSDAVEFHTAP